MLHLLSLHICLLREARGGIAEVDYWRMCVIFNTQKKLQKILQEKYRCECDLKIPPKKGPKGPESAVDTENRMIVCCSSEIEAWYIPHVLSTFHSRWQT